MIKNDFILKVYDPLTNTIYIKKDIYNVTNEQAILKSERLLEGNKRLKNNFMNI